MLLMVSATITSQILTTFENKLASVMVLTAFIPMLMDTGGNTGSQASVSIIRALSLGEIGNRDIFKVLWKEIRVALCCGISLSVICFAKLMLFDRVIMGNDGVTVIVAIVISLTILVEIILAKIVGCTLPIVAKNRL